MKKKDPGETILTDEQILGAKPAAYQGFMFNKKTGKATFICWPACRFPRYKGTVVLEQKQATSKAHAMVRAEQILQKRKRRHLRTMAKRQEVA